MKKTKPLKSYIIFIFLLLPVDLLAKNLSLDEAIFLAQKNNETILLTLQDLEKNLHQVREVKSAIYPNISLEGRYQRFLKDPVFFTQTFPIKNQFEASLNVSQVLWTFGKIGGALEAAKANLKVTELTKKLSMSEIEFVTKSAYNACLLSKEQLEIARGSLTNAKENLQILQRKFSGGRAPKADLLRLRADEEARRAQVKMSEAAYKQSLMTLSRLLSLDSDANLVLTTALEKRNFPVFSQNKIKESIKGSLPRLEVLKAAASLAKSAADVKKADRYPTLAAFGSYLYSGGSQKTIKVDDLQDYYLVGLSLKWDIWNGGATSAKYQQAEVDRAKADIQYRKGKRDLALNLDKALSQYEALLGSYKSMQEAEKLAAQSFKITQKRYGTGQSSVTEINSAEAAWTQVKLQLAASLFQINKTVAEIENLTMKKRGDLR